MKYQTLERRISYNHTENFDTFSERSNNRNGGGGGEEEEEATSRNSSSVPLSPPTAEEYQSLLQEVAHLKSAVTSRERSFRNDIIRESRRREDLEERLRSEFLDNPKKKISQVTFASTADDIINIKESKQNDDDDDSMDIYGLERNDSQKTDTSEVKAEYIQDNGCEIPLLPQDSFSYLAFSKYKSTAMLVSIMVLGVQYTTLIVLFVDTFSNGRPGNILGVPAGINQSTATIQVVALFIIVMSQTDLHDSLNTLFIGYNQADLQKNFRRPVYKWRWLASLSIRISVTLLALIVTFLMIVTESDTTQLLLDFTSIEFVTNLDNIFFWLTAYGYLGLGAQRDATLLLNAKGPSIITKGLKHKNLHLSLSSDVERNGPVKRRFRRATFLLFVLCCMMGGWAYIFLNVRKGDYLCQSIFVQFSDEFNPDLAPFSGMYDIGCSDQAPRCRRMKYIERGDGEGALNETAKFAYCIGGRAWAFTFGDEPTDVNDGKIGPCQWKAKSMEINPKSQESYDIMSTVNEHWQVVNSRGSLVPFSHFTLQCYDCMYDPEFCGGEGRGECVNNRCVCKEGWFGRRCEFFSPCNTLELADPEHQSSFYCGGHAYPTSYKIATTEDGSPVLKYARPVYEGQDSNGINHIFYNGRRWKLVHHQHHDMDVTSPGFHGYWSPYHVGCSSEEMGVDTPRDATSPAGLQWFRSKVVTTDKRLQGVDITAPIEAKLLCTTCSNTSNPCSYEGICHDDGTCECTTGATGKLCQIRPQNNGNCDLFFNTQEFDYDGGDCCKETCVSTADHQCGRGIVVNSLGIEKLDYIGFNNCDDPNVARTIAGSATLFDIKERGTVRCGLKVTTEWFYNFMADQCRIIAGAVLDDPDAVQLFNFTNDRFTGLIENKFDIVFWTDFTANRDIFEVTAQSPFAYSSMPYYFGGLVFAGRKPFGLCADKGDFFSPQCLELKICLVGGTTWYDTAMKVFPSETIVAYNEFSETVMGLENGECNVIGGSQVDVELIAIRPEGFTGSEDEYEVGSQIYFKSFESWITRPNDRQWTKFISWVFEALVQAEESNITQATHNQMATTDAFGEVFTNVFRDAVAVVGNYGELWEKNLPFKREGMNEIAKGDTGILLANEFGRFDDVGPPPKPNGAIQTILDRGYLKCGVVGIIGFADFDEVESEWTGFEVDFCKGISAALFNGAINVDFIRLSVVDRFAALKRGSVDIVGGVTRTLEREVNFGVDKDSFDFTPAVFHDGMIFAGPEPYAKCAEDLDFTEGACADTTICVPEGSSFFTALVGNLNVPEEKLVLSTSVYDAFTMHAAGDCNVVTGETAMLTKEALEMAGYPMSLTPNYYIGSKKMTKEPLCFMTNADDSQYSDFLRWIIYAYFYAEEKGITQTNSMNMPHTHLFGDDEKLQDMWRNAIKAVGNYADIYERNLQGIIPRSGFNLLNDLKSPQLYAAPGTA